MRRAILSDIHGNLEALKAVLADIRAQGCSQVLCLGDIVGYGPEPAACVDVARSFDATILGNHDLAALFDPEGFSSAAEHAIMWTRRQMEAGDTTEKCLQRLDFLANLPRTRREGSLMFVHGSVRNPINEYVFPEDVYNSRKMEKLFSMIQRVCFQGHTHVAGIFTTEMNFLRPDEIGYRFELGQEKIMVNVGSVGQPRDGDWRSSYVILEGETVHFRRVDYNVDATVQKIYEIPDLDNSLGDRLREGR